MANDPLNEGRREEKSKATSKGNPDPAAPAEARQPPTADEAREEQRRTAKAVMEEQARVIADYLRNILPGWSIRSEGHSDETVAPQQVPGKGPGLQR